MTKKYYNLDTMSVTDRKKIFESNPKDYVYSVLHDIVDKSYALIEEHEKELHTTFEEALPFEVLTQLLYFMSGIYDLDDMFSQVNEIEQLLRNKSSLRKYNN